MSSKLQLLPEISALQLWPGSGDTSSSTDLSRLFTESTEVAKTAQQPFQSEQDRKIFIDISAAAQLMEEELYLLDTSVPPTAENRNIFVTLSKLKSLHNRSPTNLEQLTEWVSPFTPGFLFFLHLAHHSY
jgi:hypothetical protein